MILFFQALTERAKIIAEREASFDRAIRAVWTRALEKEPLERAIERKRYIAIAAIFRNEEDSKFLVPRWLREDKGFWEEVRRRKKS